MDASLRLLLFAALWTILTGGDVVRSWGIGVGVVLLTVVSSYVVERAARVQPLMTRFRIRGLLRFVPYFVRKTAVGAVDVGLRALRPSMPLAPAIVDYELRMRPDAFATFFFMGVISLLPGTLSANLDGRTLYVHVIDHHRPIRAQLAKLETLVASVFGEELVRASPGGEST